MTDMKLVASPPFGFKHREDPKRFAERLKDFSVRIEEIAQQFAAGAVEVYLDDEDNAFTVHLLRPLSEEEQVENLLLEQENALQKARRFLLCCRLSKNPHSPMSQRAALTVQALEENVRVIKAELAGLRALEAMPEEVL